MHKDWMKLDNAAKIYPLIESDYITTVFRFSMTLDRIINKDTLSTALEHVMKRFPYYKVTLKRGFFWYYLEENTKALEVKEDIGMACKRMIKEETNGYLFRVLYVENKISVEFNHILGDGTACLTFLSTLVSEYLKLEGCDVSLNEWIKDIEEEVSEKEYEDSHSLIGKEHLKTHGGKLDTIKNVFHMKNRLIKKSHYNVISSVIDANKLYQTAKKYNVSITVLLTAIYLESMFEIQKEQITNKTKKRPVAIQVPINMRKRLESQTMRNFSLFIIPYLKPNKEYKFEEILELVKTYFKDKTDIDYLLKLMVQNYKTEKSIFVRLLPLRLKGLVTPLIYKTAGVDTYSGTISNIGMVHLPESIEKHVNRIDFLLGPCPLTKNTAAVTGYQDKVYISFGRNIKEATVEQKFFNKLVELGVEVQVESDGDIS